VPRVTRRLAALAGLAVCASVLPVLAAPGASAVAPASGAVFLNELHYDNDGADAGEFVEVANPGGRDLTGWSVVAYNGSTGASYGSVPLDGTSPVQARAFAGLQNGAPDGLALVDAGGALVQFLSYEGVFRAVGGPADGAQSTDIGRAEGSATPPGFSLQLTGTGTSYGDFSWTGPAAASPGEPNSSQTFGTTSDPDPEPVAVTPISQVQGSGSRSPLDGSSVVVEAVVTSLSTSRDVLDGFFVQEEDADADADPATSEGLFVFCRGTCPTELAAGDLVRASGEVDEFFGMTQLNITRGSLQRLSSGNPLPTPTEVALPAGGSTRAADTFEPVEGMVVTFPTTLAVSEYFELARYGQLTLTAGGRPYQHTHTDRPSVEGYAAHLAELNTRRIYLDDDNNDQNDATTGPDSDEPYPYPSGGLSVDNTVRGGDTITGLTGVLHWSFAGQSGTDAWRIRPMPTESYVFDRVNARPDAPEDVGGRLTVASFNVLNYFTTLDTTASSRDGDCGPSATMDCRGADSARELERQRAKIVDALARIDADVVGLIEIQNDGGASLRDLVDALNARLGAGSYEAIDTGTIGSDAIAVAFIYRPATVAPVGEHRVLDASVDPRFRDDRNRPALVQTFRERATGERFTAAINHFKSKGSSCGAEDPDLRDGAGNCNRTRTAAAQALADFLAHPGNRQGDPDVLVLGDLNAYRMEDPIRALQDAGYSDLITRYGGDKAYGYVFDGQLGYLDHALANPALLPQVTGATEWHANADEVPLLDYNDELRDVPGEAAFERESAARDLYAPDAYRSSDHDAVVVGLELSRRPA
jgi:predicted extracellular nuclease